MFQNICQFASGSCWSKTCFSGPKALMNLVETLAEKDYFGLVMTSGNNNHDISPGAAVMQCWMWWKIAAKSHLLKYLHCWHLSRTNREMIKRRKRGGKGCGASGGLERERTWVKTWRAFIETAVTDRIHADCWNNRPPPQLSEVWGDVENKHTHTHTWMHRRRKTRCIQCIRERHQITYFHAPLSMSYFTNPPKRLIREQMWRCSWVSATVWRCPRRGRLLRWLATTLTRVQSAVSHSNWWSWDGLFVAVP